MSYRDEFEELGSAGLIGRFGSSLKKLEDVVYGSNFTAAFVVFVSVAVLALILWTSNNGTGGGDGDFVAEVPVIRADKAPVRVEPDDPGGMKIVHRDSTVLNAFSSGGVGHRKKVENLLAKNEVEEPLPRSTLFSGIDSGDSAASGGSASAGDSDLAKTPSVSVVSGAGDSGKEGDAGEVSERVAGLSQRDDQRGVSSDSSSTTTTSSSVAVVRGGVVAVKRVEPKIEAVKKKPVVKVKEASEKPVAVLEKEASRGKEKESGTADSVSGKSASGGVKPVGATKSVHDKPAGKGSGGSGSGSSSPSSSGDKVAALNGIKPAVGAAAKAKAVPSGSGGYFVQLSSVRSASATAGEWRKLKGKYAAFMRDSIGYRVERADLGAKGIFFRIQAGPLSKAEAVSLCNSIKKVNPQGCFVTGR